MREILFRGKAKYENGSIKKGVWVYGDLIRVNGITKIYDDVLGYVEVNPETVGQFTGLYDKNGERIFEGDIIHSTETKETAVVQWFPEHSAFMVWCKASNEVGFLYECTKLITEVIVNVHDNPELLEVQT